MIIIIRFTPLNHKIIIHIDGIVLKSPLHLVGKLEKEVLVTDNHHTYPCLFIKWYP